MKTGNMISLCETIDLNSLFLKGILGNKPTMPVSDYNSMFTETAN